MAMTMIGLIHVLVWLSYSMISYNNDNNIINFVHGQPVPDHHKQRVHTTLPPHRQNDMLFLHDSNFEKLTQASTGRTTGNWLIYFYTDNDRTKMHGDMLSTEILAEEYHTTIAAMNIVENEKTKHKSSSTFRRFSMKRIPSILYIEAKTGLAYRIPKLNNYGYSWDDIIEFMKHPDQELGFEIPKQKTIWSIVYEEIQRDIHSTAFVFISIFVLMIVGLYGANHLANYIVNKTMPLEGTEVDDLNTKKRR